jgi:hypothetical protein
MININRGSALSQLLLQHSTSTPRFFIRAHTKTATNETTMKFTPQSTAYYLLLSQTILNNTPSNASAFLSPSQTATRCNTIHDTTKCARFTNNNYLRIVPLPASKSDEDVRKSAIDAVVEEKNGVDEVEEENTSVRVLTCILLLLDGDLLFVGAYLLLFD